MPDARCPVCGLEFPEDMAESLGAFVVERAGRRHYLCSAACRDAFAAPA